MVGSTNFFEINLHDGDGNILLGIDEGNTGQKLVFDIVNTSGKDIMLNALDLATAENNNKYHFSFAFRPGTISSNAFNTITLKVFINSSEPNDASFGNGDQWEFKRDDKTQSFYLVSKIEKVFPVNKTITFVLEKISASPDGGARGTRVEIKYDNLKLGDTVLTGNRLKNLNILNQRGKKQVPLYVGFIGSNTILNDGSENTLTLSIQLLPRLESSLAAKSLVVDNSSGKNLSNLSNLSTIDIIEIENYIKKDVNIQQLISNQIRLLKYIDLGGVLSRVFGNNTIVKLLLSDLITILKSSVDYSVKYRSLKTFLANPIVKSLLPGLNQLFVDNLLDDFLQKLNEVQSNVVSQEDIATLLFLLKDLGLPYQNLTKLQGLNVIDKIVDNIERSLSSQVVPLKELDEAVKFTISFDVASAENNQWALVSQNDADNISPEIAEGSPQREKWIYGGLQKQGITPQWSFICTKGLNLGERSEILKLSISNIKTRLLAGYANLYVHYENIPGYWDGHITVPIHKGPLVYREKEISFGKDQTVKVACVGIGTDKPQAKLHVKKDSSLPLALSVEGSTTIEGNLLVKNGNVAIEVTDPNMIRTLAIDKGSKGIYGIAQERNNSDNNGWRMSLMTEGTKRMTIMNNGNIGIGTNNPNERLHIEQGSLLIKNQSGIHNNGIQFQSHYVDDTASIKFYQREGENSVLEINIGNDNASTGHEPDNIALMPSGNVGIGINTPNKGRLHINGSCTNAFYRYDLEKEGIRDNRHYQTPAPAPYSLYAEKAIAAEQFSAFSDLRIKEIKGNSNSQVDLKTLLQIQVTDYYYRDKIANGNRLKKKVIGQQIASVYPQAVSTHIDIVPDILEFAVIEENWVTLNNHNLKIGDKVKILWNDHNSQLFTIEDITTDKFKIPLNYTGDIFVYGREVDDFHVVDYDALSILHISATQELYKIIKKLQENIANLEIQLIASS